MFCAALGHSLFIVVIVVIMIMIIRCINSSPVVAERVASLAAAALSEAPVTGSSIVLLQGAWMLGQSGGIVRTHSPGFYHPPPCLGVGRLHTPRLASSEHRTQHDVSRSGVRKS